MTTQSIAKMIMTETERQVNVEIETKRIIWISNN